MISNYATATVRLESLLKDPQTKEAIDKALSTYPLYHGKKDYDLIPTREQLNERILNHYLDREIGFETVGRFIEKLRISMCEIMPYYNELFKTIEIMSDIEDPFGNVDYTETFEEERTGNTTSQGTATAQGTDKVVGSSNDEGTTTGKNELKRSDTPQNEVENIDNYLTEYNEENQNVTTRNNGSTTTDTTSNSTSSSQGTSSSGSTSKHTFTKKGNQGVNTYAHDMNEFRTSIMDVVDRIVYDKRIAELFLLVW